MPLVFANFRINREKKRYCFGWLQGDVGAGHIGSRAFALFALPTLLPCPGKCRIFATLAPNIQGRAGGTITCSVAAIRHSCELKRTNKAEADVVVPIVRRVVVAIGGAAILRVVVPTAAAIHAVVALSVIDHWRKSTLSRKFRVLAWARNASNGRAWRWQADSLHSPEL